VACAVAQKIIRPNVFRPTGFSPNHLHPGQLNLAHVVRNKKNIKKKLKQKSASAHLVRYRLRSMKAVQSQPERLRRRGFVKEMNFKSGVKGWGSNRGWQWTEWGWQHEEGSWFHRWGDAYLKEQLVICNEKDTNGRARVTADEEWVLHVDW